jgi:hypothetical protein
MLDLGRQKLVGHGQVEVINGALGRRRWDGAAARS